jgi:enoyl-CoA hydratase
MSDGVVLSRRAGVIEVVLDRPKVNALNRALLAALGRELDALSHEEGVRGVLLRAEGGCFSAGLDLREVAALEDDALAGFLEDLDRAFGAAYRLPMPVAAAVQGHAIAGGLLLALCADHVVLGRGAFKLGLTELAVGIPFPRIPFEIARAALGPRALRKLVYEAGVVGPEEAHDLGVGDAVSDTPLEDARRWLATVTSHPPQAFRIAKRQMRGEVLARMAAQSLEERQELLRALAVTRARVGRG